MQQAYIKCLAIRIPIGITQYPEPTFYRDLTKRNLQNGKIELYCREAIYWLDSLVYSEKQLTWLGDIKTKVLRVLPEAEVVVYEADANYHTGSGKIFNLHSLQKAWIRKIVPKKKSTLKILKEPDVIVDEELITLPSLVPLLSGKYEYQLYKALCRYGTRLHYERLLQFEYLFRAAKLYNQYNEEKLLPKKLLKLTHKAFDYITEEIKKNPDGFKQKLKKKELREARKKNALKLQARNKKTSEANAAKVKQAIATGKYHKADGTTLNISAITNATKLSRVTICKIINKFK